MEVGRKNHFNRVATNKNMKSPSPKDFDYLSGQKTSFITGHASHRQNYEVSRQPLYHQCGVIGLILEIDELSFAGKMAHKTVVGFRAF